jgi:26S proteasome regulatory subunit N2
MTGSGLTLTSASGIVALLSEPERELKVFALKKLNNVVNDFWAEIADALQTLEELSEDESFPEHELASLVVSKVYYHLGSFDDSITFALSAGDKFDVTSTSEFVQTIISKCIDKYATQCARNFDEDAEESIDPRLADVVNRMFERCFADKEYKLAVGIALETRRMDILQKAIKDSGQEGEMLAYCLKVTLSLNESRKLRNTVLRLLVELYTVTDHPDYISVAQCYIFLDEPVSMADVLVKLAKGNEDDNLTAYQIAFDLYESATQHFLRRVKDSFRLLLPELAKEDQLQDDRTDTETMETDSKEGTPDGEKEESQEAESMEDRLSEKLEAETEKDPVPEPEPEPEWVSKLRSINSILTGELTIAMNQDFLIRNNHTDLQLLKNLKDCSRHSICHNGTVIANAFMHCGTTADTFLRENLEWLKKATNWAKFTATASLGVIHQGHEKEALNLMSAYLPKDSSSTGQYAEGGGLYALGLIHANHGQNVMEYLMKETRSHTEEVVRHGGCLGLGLAAMGTADIDAYKLLQDCLNQDDAVVGEAAGIGMGLVMVGTGNVHILNDMIEYSQATQHEKIQRGLALGIAMVMYGRLEEADPCIEELVNSKDPLLRRAGVFVIATAYCGSGNNQAVRRLLHIGVSDVDNDVRRASITCIGFLLFRSYEQCPAMVALLLESYNPHVRCGAVSALGVACAGTGYKEALGMIEPLCSDPVSFVRQAAMIATALILVQQTEAMSSKVISFRERYMKTSMDKHETNITKFGAILAQGIIDAGGRNVTVSLQSRTGHTNMAAVVGLLVFHQFWFWYPLCHFMSLAFVPTSLVALNRDLKMPKVNFISKAKPSMFGYHPPLEKEKKEEKGKVATAVLSVTAKAKARAQKKEAEKMEVEPESGGKPEDKEATKPVKEEEQEQKNESPKNAEPSQDFSTLSNPARVLPQQWKVVSLEECRYSPIKALSPGGVVLFKDTLTDTPEELVEPLKANVPGQEEEEEEPPPPEPFEWTGD